MGLKSEGVRSGRFKGGWGAAPIPLLASAFVSVSRLFPPYKTQRIVHYPINDDGADTQSSAAFKIYGSDTASQLCCYATLQNAQLRSFRVVSNLNVKRQVGRVSSKFRLGGPQCISPTRYFACTFVNCGCVKNLVTKQVCVAISACGGVCDKLPADKMFAGIKFQQTDVQNRLPLFTEFYTHHTMISVCAQSQSRGM